MSRTVLPDLFGAWGALVETTKGPHVALRWMLSPQLGLPREAFDVWELTKAVSNKEIDFSVHTITNGWRQVDFGERPVAAVRIRLDATSSTTIVRAHSGPVGTGKVVDEERVTNGGGFATLLGSAIRSVTFLGSAVVTEVLVVDLQELVDNPGWTLVEHVGLPVDDGLAGYYSTDQQGPIGALTSPFKAAVARVLTGTPAAGWPALTETGLSAPPYEVPDPEGLVLDELAATLDHLKAMAATEPEPHRHADFEHVVAVPPPTSVHGVRAPSRWDADSRATVRPLGSMLMAAGRDSFAALALGFGTTRGLTRQGDNPGDLTHLPPLSATTMTTAEAGPAVGAAAASARATNPNRTPLFLVTLNHKVLLEFEAFGIEIPFDAELASLVVNPSFSTPDAAQAVTAGPPDAVRTQLDRPAAIDRPWLEVVDVAWDNPAVTAGSQIVPTGWVVIQSIGGSDPELLVDKRLSGGPRPHVPALTHEGEPDRVHFIRSAVEEAFPGDPTDVGFAVAGCDWFGRWGPWTSVVHPRVVVPPQAPALHGVDLQVDADGVGPTGSVVVEFTWDWADRTPEAIHLRTRLHADGGAPPPVDGSVLVPAGPTVPDRVIDFATATAETPPAGVVELEEERAGDLRVYQTVVGGVADVFGAGARVRATVQARGSERVRPGVLGAFSPPMSEVANSPTPPPAPFVPTAMRWASLPTGGVARATLDWTGTAHTFVVYHADETAIARELDLLSPDLNTPASTRLAALRPLEFGAARRAFRRVAEGLATPRLEVELPRGSQLIHFYAVAPVSEAGAERPLPIGGNDYMAVATPSLSVPTPPVLAARVDGDAVSLTVEATTDPAPVGEVHLLRVRGRRLAGTPEAAGGPFLTAPASAATSSAAGDVLTWRLADPDPGPPWEPVYYRALARGVTDGPGGVIAGASPPSAAVEVVVPAAEPPTVADLVVAPDTASPTEHLATFATDASAARTRLGAFVVTVTIVHATAAAPTVATLREAFGDLPVITGPAPGDAPALTLRRPDATAPFRVTARLGEQPASVTVEVADPLRRRTRASWSLP